MSILSDKAIISLSGGCDSATCLGVAVDEYGPGNVIAVSFEYGQKHAKELECADALCAYYNVEHVTIELGRCGIFDGADCSLLRDSDKAIPNGSYSEQINENGVSTYVPFRNGLMLSCLAAKAVSIDSGADWVIFLGAHSDDAAGNAYADCSRAFVDAISQAIEIGTYGKVAVKAPFVEMNKADVVAAGLRLGVPYELTWSCYKGGERQCGRCGTCLDRIAAFESNGVLDPVPYDEVI